MKKYQLAIIIVLGVAGLIFGGIFYVLNYFMNQPLYQPGDLAGKTIRVAEQKGEADYWVMEDNIRLYHAEQGRGRKILMIHGGPGIPFSGPWKCLDSLDYTFSYYDQRGSGKSTRPFDVFDSASYYTNMSLLETTLGIGAQLKDIERIRMLWQQEKITLIGHSFGGFLAAMYAAEFPEKVEAMVLVAPADVLVFPPEDGGLFELVKSRLSGDMLDEYNDYLNSYLDFGNIFEHSEKQLANLHRDFYRYYSAAASDRSFAIPELPEPSAVGGWMVFGLYFSLGKTHDYSESLRRVWAPVLVIHGKNDLQSEASSKQYAELMPNSRFKVIENAGHFSFEEQGDRFQQLVDRFLKAHL